MSWTFSEFLLWSRFFLFSFVCSFCFHFGSGWFGMQCVNPMRTGDNVHQKMTHTKFHIVEVNSVSNCVTPYLLWNRQSVNTSQQKKSKTPQKKRVIKSANKKATNKTPIYRLLLFNSRIFCYYSLQWYEYFFSLFWIVTWAYCRSFHLTAYITTEMVRGMPSRS